MSVVDTVARIHARPLSGSRILEIGAGVHNPLGCSLIALSMSCAEAISVDPGAVLSSHLDDALTVGLVGKILPTPQFARIAQGADRSHDLHKQDRPTPECIDLGAARFFHCDIDSFETSGRFDVIHSNATIEHIADLPSVCKRMFAMTEDGGIHIHKIDFIDHRYYTLDDPKDLDAFRFLLVGEEDLLTDCNRLRISEVVSLFRNAGFDVLPTHALWRRDVPSDALAHLQPRFRTLSSADIETTCAIFCVPEASVKAFRILVQYLFLEEDVLKPRALRQEYLGEWRSPDPIL